MPARPIDTRPQRMGVEGGVAALHGRNDTVLVVEVRGDDLDLAEILTVKRIGPARYGAHVVTRLLQLANLRQTLAPTRAEHRHQRHLCLLVPKIRHCSGFGTSP